MKTFARVLPIVVVLALLTSCGRSAPPPPTGTIPPTLPPSTETPAPTDTPLPLPTETPIPPTPTEEGFLLPLPQGEPQSDWNGVPVMPGAIHGEESGTDGYVFTVQASLEEIQNFYLSELPKIGWESMANW